jgi:hypothetical protein
MKKNKYPPQEVPMKKIHAPKRSEKPIPEIEKTHKHIHKPQTPTATDFRNRQGKHTSSSAVSSDYFYYYTF